LPNLTSLKDFVGVPDAATLDVWGRNLKTFETEFAEAMHPFVYLISLPRAEKIDVWLDRFDEDDDWLLECRPHLTSLRLGCSSESRISFKQFQALFSNFPNITELNLNLGVNGFVEEVPFFFPID
jgi:hypothetical protein